MKDNKRISVGRAVMWILVSTLFFSGSAFMGWLYYLHIKGRKYHDDQYRIVALVQSTPQAGSLKTVYLAEVLGLSVDHPENLYQFDAHAATGAMLANPLIKDAVIRKILPGTLYVHYCLRVPCAVAADFTNTVIDDEGYLFPYKPFFTPKRLPSIALGIKESECKWGACVKDRLPVQLAFELISEFEKLEQDQFSLKHVDAVNANGGSYGRREIVLILEEKHPSTQSQSPGSNSEVYLRLGADHWARDLANFSVLQSALLKGMKAEEKSSSMVIDFRVPHLAFLRR